MKDQASPIRRRKIANATSSDGVRIKRAYAAPSRSDGRRILVDRIWPRGLNRNSLALEAWLKDVAPSSDLRRWFNHDPARWQEFVSRYHAELAKTPAREAFAELTNHAQQGVLTLVYAARDEAHNNAVVLREAILERLASGKHARK
jgi:uncharacterized protein YeaO (DUF488 family)